MFWDLRHAFLFGLYCGNVEGARLDGVLSHIDAVRINLSADSHAYCFELLAFVDMISMKYYQVHFLHLRGIVVGPWPCMWVY